MEDPYAFIMEDAIIPPAQQKILDTCPFINEIPVPVNGNGKRNADKEKSPPLSDKVSSETIGITICSLPSPEDDDKEESTPVQTKEGDEEDVYQTPEEQLGAIPSQEEQRNDQVVAVGSEKKVNDDGVRVRESSLPSVDLDRDTDLVFSEDKSLLDDSISTEIVDNEDVYGNLVKEPCGIEISRSELRGNDDFCGNLAKEARASEISRSELGKNDSLKRKSPLIDDLGLSESEILELGFTNVEDETVGDVEEPIDAFEDAQMVDEGANQNYESDRVSVELDEVNVAMEEDVQIVVEAANLRNVSEKVSVELDGNTVTEVLEPEFGDDDGDPENEKDLGNEMDKENLIGSNNSLQNEDNEKLKFNANVEELEKFESNNINDLGSGLISEAPQGQRRLPLSILEVIQKMEGLGHGGRQGTSSGREDGGSGEAESSAQGDTRGQEVDNLCLDGKEVIEDGSPETDTQPIVTLTDLVDAEDDDILVAAIKAGWSFPRPRWWRPEGYGTNNSNLNN
ncbi:hypothetical protein FRX31_004323 [Thalictrum thalictroides]|uniref:Uncharacterized protein n=1 Tax=Thalictrum thalictroides TaxID=46969 RepID=A0A7J6X8H7_THATH|nr:hypothetical protein FRX31_004323 [Thalictrum thalictroides]